MASFTFFRTVKDHKQKSVKIKIILTEKENDTFNAEAYDSEGRYFKSTMNKNYQRYRNIFLNFADKVIYDNFDGYLTVYLDGGGFCDFNGLSLIRTVSDIDEETDTLREKLVELENEKKLFTIMMS